MRSRPVLAVLVVLLAARAADAGPAFPVLRSKDLEPYRRAIASFESALGRSLEHFDLATQEEAAVVREVERLAPEMVVAVGTDALRFAAGRFPARPLVFLMVLDSRPYRDRPGPITGVTLEVPPGSQIEALRALRPDLRSIGVIFDPAESAMRISRLIEAAGKAGITVVAQPAANAKEAMTAMPEIFGQCDAFVLVPDHSTASEPSFELAVLLSLRHRVTLLAPSRKYVEKGALAALGTSYEDIGAQAAALARRMLSGAPAPLEESPRLLRLIVNRKIAGKLGIAVPNGYRGQDVEIVS